MATSQKISTLTATKRRKLKQTKFLQEMKEEMKRVSWTTKEELTICTKIVLSAIFILGTGIYLIDLFVRFSLNGLEAIVKFIGG